MFDEQGVRQSWDAVMAQYRLLVSFITETLHLPDTRCLETLYLVVAAEVLGRHDSPETRNRLAAWLIRAHCYLPYTGGSTKRKLQLDLDTVVAGGTAMWTELFESIRRSATQHGRSRAFEASWFLKRGASGSHAARGVDSLVAHLAWLVAHDLGAVDWRSGAALPSDRPASAGRKSGWVNAQLFESSELGGRQDVKRVGNRVYLERRQGAALLCEARASEVIPYVLRSAIGPDALAAQCIPTDDLGLLGSPTEFVERRERLLAERIESMLQRLERGEHLRYLRPSVPLTLPAADVLAEARRRSSGRARESTHLEFKASFAFAYPSYEEWALGKSVVAKTIAALANSGGGVLLIGVTDDGEVVGIEREEEAYAAMCMSAGKRCVELERRIREHVVKETYPTGKLGFGDATLLEISLEAVEGRTVAVVRVRGSRSFIWWKNNRESAPPSWVLLERIGASSVSLQAPVGQEFDVVIEEVATNGKVVDPKALNLPIRQRFPLTQR